MPSKSKSSLHMRRRPRRMRSAAFIRELVAETKLSAADLVWPLFVHDQQSVSTIKEMPGIPRLNEAALLQQCETAVKYKLPMIALFPCVAGELRTHDGREAYNDQGLIQSSIRIVKREFPKLGVMADVALDPYTSHGHDGLLDDAGNVLNDETIAVLSRQALSLADAGADVVAPSDMMDGRIGVIRDNLEQAGFTDTRIMSYAIKYASALYEPFRNLVGSASRLKGDKRTYQMDYRNRLEARLEAELDLEQGADMLMVKPGIAYLDIVRDLAERSPIPVFAYQVSGEHAMIKAAAEQGLIDLMPVVIEMLTAFKRAGAAGILSYFAHLAAQAVD